MNAFLEKKTPQILERGHASLDALVSAILTDLGAHGARRLIVVQPDSSWFLLLLLHHLHFLLLLAALFPV